MPASDWWRAEGETGKSSECRAKTAMPEWTELETERKASDTADAVIENYEAREREIRAKRDRALAEGIAGRVTVP
jgi:hypothetical protein